MKEYIKDNSILIIPNNIKENIIKEIRTNYYNYNIKVFNLNEFIKKITFDYNEETIYELMKLYNINYDISRMFIKNFYYVDKYYNNNKLDQLYDMKKSIDKYLIKDNLFNKLINNKKIIIYGYDYINKYQYNILKNVNKFIVINKKYNNYKHDIYKFDTLENEVVFIAESISKLISDGIDINHIFVSNLDSNYYNVIKRIFNMYNIPINLNDKISIYETSIGKTFINNIDKDINKIFKLIEDKYNLDNIRNKEIYNKLIDVVNKFYFIDDYLNVKDSIIEIIKKTYLSNVKYNNAINEIDIKDNIINDDKYIFLVGFNLNSIPKIYKDEDYISDNIKLDYMEKSFELNLINKDLYYKLISNIKNLVISYKEKYLNESFYPSILIDEYSMNVIDKKNYISLYSNQINKIKLGGYIDNLIKYNQYNENIGILYNNYKLDYMTYDNRYNMIDKNNLYKYLDNKLNMSYSSMDNYYHCSFKYYLSNILNLNYFEETIQTYIGNLYHYMLSKAFIKDFDFDNTLKYFIDNNPYPKSYKSEYFLNKVIDELKLVIKTIEYQNTFHNMDESFYERKISVDKSNVINITFKGFIDKLLKKSDYIVIIDYKTYMMDISLNYLPYGLSMQLPVYLYLTKNMNKDYKIIGFYLQQVLFGNFNKDKNKTLNELKKSNLRLKGYSLGNESILYNFDSGLENSEVIYGMKLNDKGFGTYSKVLTDKQIDNIIKLTNRKIDECIDNVVDAKFDINPKRINNKDIGCTYCKYKDICYVTNRDKVDLEDIKNIDFLN